MDPIEVRLESNDFPCEHVRVSELTMRERVSDLYVIDLAMVSFGDDVLDVDKVTGASVEVVFSHGTEVVRRVQGFVTHSTDSMVTEEDFNAFRLRIAPDLFTTSLVQLQEVFVDRTIPSIIEEKLGRADHAFAMRLSAGAEQRYRPRPFVVQYGETDLTFIRRLAEHWGISFYFEHVDGRERVVFTDMNEGFLGGDEGRPPSIVFRPRGERRDVYRLELDSQVAPRVHAVSDFNDDTPNVDLFGRAEIAEAHAGGIVEHGTNHRTPEEGRWLANVRAEERHAGMRVLSGESGLPTLGAGRRVNLEDHPRYDGKELLITEVEHHIKQPVAGAKGAAEYHNRFRAIEATTPFRPARSTARPAIAGVLSGVIEPEHPGSESVWIDERGRYYVRMLFETAPSEDNHHVSLPIRMAQPHAGGDAGMHFPLRPGTEVLVAFVGGDPDRPVIVGALHHGAMLNPVTRLDATRNRIRTTSGVVIEINDGF